MPKKRHKPLSLANATKILRAHSTDIDPPGLVEFENAFQSRSDNAITLRSDWEAAFPGMGSYGADSIDDNVEDYLNAAFHVSRAGYTIYFSRFAPFTWVAELGDLFTIYEDGTISADGLRNEVVGESTEWLQQVWPGCMIRFKGSGNPLYTITYVTSDTRIITNKPMDGSGEYEIFRVHPATRAEWPIKFESLGGYLVYGSVDISQPIDEKYISGPFFSNINRPNLGVWFGTDPVSEEVVIPMAAISVGFDENFYGGPHQDINLKHFPPITVAGDKGVVFARPWFGTGMYQPDEPTKRIRWTERETKLVSSGSAENISGMRASTTEPDLVTLAGEVNSIDVDGEHIEVGDLESNCSQYLYPPDNEIIKRKPFGDAVLTRPFADLILGENGLLGQDDGTTFATGQTATLRDGVKFFDPPGFGGTAYYVIVGDADSTDGVILYFTDPNTISRATTAVSDSFFGVTYSVINGLVIAVGQGGRCMTSADQGVTWVNRSVGTSVDLFAAAADREGRAIVIVGDLDPSEPACYFSDDGINWTQVTGLGDAPLVDVTFRDHDGCFYAVSSSGKVYRIRRRVTIPQSGTVLGTIGEGSDYVTDVLWDGTHFVAVGSKIWTSPTGATWTERATPSATLLSIAFNTFNGTDMVAVGVGGIIYRSWNNGISWTTATSPVSVDLREVIYHQPTVSEGRWVAVGKEGNVLRSTDGATWNTMTFPVTDDIFSVASDQTNTTLNQRHLYAVAGDGNLYTARWESGAGWTPWALPEDLADVAYWDQEHVKDVSGRNFVDPHVPSPGTSLLGIKFGGMARLILHSGSLLQTFQKLDNNAGGGAVYYFKPSTNEYLIGGNWSTAEPLPVKNNSAIDDPTSFFPIIMIRLWAPRFVNNPTLVFDGFITSSDFGVTWSFEEFPNTKIWGKPQALDLSPWGRAVQLSSTNFTPALSDGTDFYLVQSSNQIGYMSNFIILDPPELVVTAEEVE